MESSKQEDNGHHQIVCRCKCSTTWLTTQTPTKCGTNCQACMKNALNKASLVRKIVRLKYRDGESIVVHINTFMGLVYQLAVAMFPLHDAMQALLLECTLQDSWENQVVSLSTSCQEENSSLQVVKTSILNEEMSRKGKGVMS